MQRWSQLSKEGPVPSADLSSELLISSQVPGSGGRAVSTCSRASIMGGDSSGQVPGRALLCSGNPQIRKHQPENTSGTGSTISPHWSLCFFSLGIKGGQGHGRPTPLLCPDSTWGLPQYILWHWHCSGHGHNIHLSHL